MADLGFSVFIKRIVATEGQTIEGQCQNDELACDVEIYIDGEKIGEEYLDDNLFYSPFSKIAVPQGYVFVMGDNRADSEDSRVYGPIETSSIVGKVD